MFVVVKGHRRDGDVGVGQGLADDPAVRHLAPALFRLQTVRRCLLLQLLPLCCCGTILSGSALPAGLFLKGNVQNSNVSECMLVLYAASTNFCSSQKSLKRSNVPREKGE